MARTSKAAAHRDKLEKLVAAGATVTQIAAKLKVTRITATRWLAELGLKGTKRGAKKGPRRKRERFSTIPAPAEQASGFEVVGSSPAHEYEVDVIAAIDTGDAVTDQRLRDIFREMVRETTQNVRDNIVPFLRTQGPTAQRISVDPLLASAVASALTNFTGQT